MDNQIRQLLHSLLGEAEAESYIELSRKQQEKENKWTARVPRIFDLIIPQTIHSLIETGKVSDGINFDFDEFFSAMFFDVSFEAFGERRPALPEAQMAKPTMKIPRSLSELRKMWDEWRNKRRLPKGPKKLGEQIKKAYIKKVQEAWQRYSEDFREGDRFNQAEAVEAIRRAAKTLEPRARTIVATETTRYYNEVRRAVYDESDAVTHYLFMAIRDHRTTPWCKSRHGLVYRKDSELLNKETPPVHWNCRSEIIPLLPSNPRHRAIIEDKSRLAGNNSRVPLPSGWNRV